MGEGNGREMGTVTISPTFSSPIFSIFIFNKNHAKAAQKKNLVFLLCGGHCYGRHYFS